MFLSYTKNSCCNIFIVLRILSDNKHINIYLKFLNASVNHLKLHFKQTMSKYKRCAV